MNFAEKILHYLDILIGDYNKTINSEKQLIENRSHLESHLKNLAEEKDMLNDKIDKILYDNQEDIKNIELNKNEELNRQRDILYEKISSVNFLILFYKFLIQLKLFIFYEFFLKIIKLTELLEESNQIISSYEKENENLKEKNLKLESNLKLLTNSHMDLEYFIF